MKLTLWANFRSPFLCLDYASMVHVFGVAPCLSREEGEGLSKFTRARFTAALQRNIRSLDALKKMSTKMATHLQSLCSGREVTNRQLSSQLPPTALISPVHQRTYDVVATYAIMSPFPHAIRNVQKHDLAHQKHRGAQGISYCRGAADVAVVGSRHTAKSSPLALSLQSSPASQPSQKARYSSQPERLSQRTCRTKTENLAKSAAQRPPRFRMHPVLTHRSLNYTSISYDVNYPPAPQSVLDHWTHMPIPVDMLNQPATEPAILATCQLVLMTDGLPWPVVVSPSTSVPISRRRPGLNIYGDSSTSTRTCPFITVLDILQALHSTLLVNVTIDEWNGSGCGSRMQQKVAWAYKERCTKMGGGWKGGVRRIDWLGAKTRLAGIEVDVVAKPVFR